MVLRRTDKEVENDFLKALLDKATFMPYSRWSFVGVVYSSHLKLVRSIFNAYKEYFL